MTDLNRNEEIAVRLTTATVESIFSLPPDKIPTHLKEDADSVANFVVHLYRQVLAQLDKNSTSPSNSGSVSSSYADLR